jgi:RHS repeat-associated protein
VLGGVTDTYTYDAHDKLSSTSSKTFGYDSNGNCTSVVVGGATTSLTYDDSNRVTGITYPSTATNSFVYNGEDLRVSKTDSAGTSAVITDGTGVASPVLKDARAVYTPGISERAGTTSKFYHGDALGSTRGITDGSQAVTDTVLYDAFGMTVSRTGTTATPFGFVGAQQYQTDSDSGLQLLGHRYYDPSIGRFISSDPIQDGDNWYAYCENEPLGLVDPEGLQPPERRTSDPRQLGKMLKDQIRRTGAVPIERGREPHQKVRLPGGEEEIIPNEHSRPDINGLRDAIKRLRGHPDKPVDPDPDDGTDVGANSGGISRNWGRGDIGRGFPVHYEPVQPWPSGPDRSGPFDRNAPIGPVPRYPEIGAAAAIVIWILKSCGGKCFEGGTLIKMADGSMKHISEIRCGDLVLSHNMRSGKNEARQVEFVFDAKTRAVIELELTNGDTIKTTDRHPIYVEGQGFLPVIKLRSGRSYLADTNGDHCGISSIFARTNRSCRVYNLLVDGTHTYYVGKAGVLVGDLMTKSVDR